MLFVEKFLSEPETLRQCPPHLFSLHVGLKDIMYAQRPAE
jgi:hypothetical protein